MSVKAKNNGAAVGHGNNKPNMNADYTHSMFIKPAEFEDSGGLTVAVHEIIEAGAGDARDSLFLQDFSNDTFGRVENSNNAGNNPDSAGTGSYEFTDGEWHYTAITRRGAGLELWAGPADGVTAPTKIGETAFSNPTDLSGRHAAANLWVGAFSFLDDFTGLLNFSVTGRKLWTAALDATEHRKESKQKHPVKTTDRWAHWLMKHKDDLDDYSGNGRPWKWAKDQIQTPVDTDDDDIETDPDDSPIPDGEIGQDPEEEEGDDGPTFRPGRSGRLVAMKIV